MAPLLFLDLPPELVPSVYVHIPQEPEGTEQPWTQLLHYTALAALLNRYDAVAVCREEDDVFLFFFPFVVVASAQSRNSLDHPRSSRFLSEAAVCF